MWLKRAPGPFSIFGYLVVGRKIKFITRIARNDIHGLLHSSDLFELDRIRANSVIDNTANTRITVGLASGAAGFQLRANAFWTSLGQSYNDQDHRDLSEHVRQGCNSFRCCLRWLR